MATQTAAKRPLGALGRMGFVVAMHAALLLVLARSFGIVPPLLFEGGELVQIEEPIEVPPPTPVVTQPILDRPTIRLDAPLDPPIDFPEDPVPEVMTGTGPQIKAGPGSAVVMPVIQGARQDPRRPLSQPAYSARDIREGIEGFVDVEVYVLPDGRVGDARILRSTGSERMDQATLDEARRRWKLIPATRDGAPIAQWYALRVKFELK